MNHFELSFNNLLNSQERTFGYRKKIKINGGPEIDALVGGQGVDEQPANGGLSNISQLSISVRLSEFDPEDAGELAEVEHEGVTRNLLNYRKLEGCYVLHVGDPEQEL